MLTPAYAAHAALWARLNAFDLDGTAPLSFSRRLARDNNWPLPFARRVVLEYKKFVLLAATCGHPVTPSDEVDQAWHLHLVYTRSYWDGLCGQVLGFALHHGPTKGGAAEGHKFQDWYGQTLHAYRAAFGTLPPADIWPAAAVRFGEAPYFRRVNVRRHLLLPRPRWPRLGRSRRRWAGLAAALVLLLVGCTTRLPLNPFNWYGTEFLRLFWALGVGLLPWAWWLRHRGRGPEEPYSGEPPSPYALARLAHSGRYLVDSALAALAHAGKIELLDEQKVKRVGAIPPDDPYERAVWNLIIFFGWSDLAALRQDAIGPNVGALRTLDEELESKGLLLPKAERRRLHRLPLLAVLGLGIFGLVKVLVGLSRHRPVGYLVLSLLGLGFAAIASLWHSAWATGRGVRLLRALAPKVQQRRLAGPLTSQTVALTVAFFGVSELRTLGLTELTQRLSPPTSSGAGSGGDGGAGEGDGGGGCGGCGGD